MAYSKKSRQEIYNHPEPRGQSDSQGGGMKHEVEKHASFSEGWHSKVKRKKKMAD